MISIHSFTATKGVRVEKVSRFELVVMVAKRKYSGFWKFEVVDYIVGYGMKSVESNEGRIGGNNSLYFSFIHYEYIYKNQSNILNKLQLYF